jgi:hypothetical protein
LVKGKGSWVPPEAAAVAASLAEINASWRCDACTLANAPAARVCEACGSVRPGPGDADNRWKQQQQQQQGKPQDKPQQKPQQSRGAAAERPGPAPAAAPAGGGWAAAARPPAAAAAPRPPSPAAAPAAAAPGDDAFPALPAAPPRGAGSSAAAGSGGGGAAAGAGGKKGKKGGKQSFNQFLQTTKVHPQASRCCFPCSTRAAAGQGGKRAYPAATPRLPLLRASNLTPGFINCSCSSSVGALPLLCHDQSPACHDQSPACPPNNAFLGASPLQNAWRNPNLRGQWAAGGGGSLATQERALLDAYARPGSE